MAAGGIASAGSDPAPQRGGSIVIALGADPASLNPALTTGINEALIGCSIYEGLTQVSAAFKTGPLLAESWTISPDGRTYDFKLRSAKWQDGAAFTSNDVKFSLLEINKKYSPIFRASGNLIDSIETPAPDRVVIHLKEPFGPFLMSLSCIGGGAIMPAHIFRDTDIRQNPASGAQPVGTGPFRLMEWKRGSYLRLDRNADYWDATKPLLASVTAQILPQPSSRLQALQTDEVDLILGLSMVPSDNPIVQANPRLKLEQSGYAPGYTFIAFNTRKKPYDDVRVRRALFMATDRAYLIKAAWFGDGKVSVGPFSDAIEWAFNSDIDYQKMYPFDTAAANRLLDEAGLPRDADGIRFKATIVYPSDTPDRAQVAQAMKNMWRSIGVDLQLEPLERAVLNTRVYQDCDFEMNIDSYNTFGDPALGITRIYSTEAQGRAYGNASGYSNAKVDELFDQAQREVTTEKRGALYRQAAEILAQDLPSISLREKHYIDAASIRLHGLWGLMGPGDLVDAWVEK
ncbi:ABC transporter substrate-binding protein [Bradyrhizobium sp. dw_78]|uniref:ABC transporter substrate-binding protein n=1 Tax=Bradyrhizobium sp. dw_78 TaxID=2719793 RepID=UPI001BD4C836|nr:ABC transporter substrate-binding protein [Bradyrhizobium sp. dw_78]